MASRRREPHREQVGAGITRRRTAVAPTLPNREDRADLAAVRRALKEGGRAQPWAKVKKALEK